ncbi:hypothetical protein HHK36_025101 [Tetracentron sinense]|uniref:Uncharacterized protein n=1 Tax=Tetracentron sinense TaxID=13715 RepID=A0A835D848_TETSI|nr:hypothetical protein HHK36_025101 [Tetracentron sinense]
MKREGHQHGMVRTYWIRQSPGNPRPDIRVINKFESPPTAGLFTKVSSKPTNHSKFTGKCGTPRCRECHTRPACKSKDKAKGTQKLRSSNVATDHRLVTWGVVDKGQGLSYAAGLSATGFLSHLSNDQWDDEVEDDVEDRSPAFHDGVVAVESNWVEEIGSGGSVEADDHDDDGMSFCDVGFVWDQVEGDEGWCLVGEM